MPAHNVLLGIAADQRSFQSLQFGKIAKGLHTPDDLVVLILQDGGADTDGFLIALFADYLGRKVYPGLAGSKRFIQGISLFADIGPENIETVLPDGLSARETRDGLRGPVEGGDPLIAVNGENTITDAL